nr:54s ribosomal protein l17, mitochondrial [Quercus suber]
MIRFLASAGKDLLIIMVSDSDEHMYEVTFARLHRECQIGMNCQVEPLISGTLVRRHCDRALTRSNGIIAAHLQMTMGYESKILETPVRHVGCQLECVRYDRNRSERERCLQSQQLQPPRRHAATASAVSEVPSSGSSHLPQKSPKASPASGPQKAFALRASAVVSRPPLLTRDLTAFEKSFYLYQKRLHERLVLPFTRYFYYKKGTPADQEWKRKYKARKTAAKDIGAYNAYSDEGWNDEVLVGNDLREPQTAIEALVRDAEGKSVIDTPDSVATPDPHEQQPATAGRDGTKLEVERPSPRVTKADETGDLTSLNRKLDRTLYLLVKNKEGVWRFPEDRVYGKENLRQAAERLLVQSCGINMNTWIVASHPIGWFMSQYKNRRTSGSGVQGNVTQIATNALVKTSKVEEREEFGEKVFFMKARIMGGQANLSANHSGYQEFRWLAKEEIATVVTTDYWRYAKNMLVSR